MVEQSAHNGQVGGSSPSRPTEIRHCPCCEQSLPLRECPKVHLDTNTLLYDDKALYLTSSQAIVLHILLRRMPHMVSYEQLITGLYGGISGGPEYAFQSLKIFVMQLRRLLEPAGLRILTRHGYGFSVVEVGKVE
ncbi:hypothetical protein LCGC14_2869560 [marine sediment metagenome]|uniref:OmpR/PhoB-type domain-containing protein n=1 Tax=marine sediment metagenome TaxID=412755 RepID=A0A0F8Y3L3_9ZZZZ